MSEPWAWPWAARWVFIPSLPNHPTIVGSYNQTNLVSVQDIICDNNPPTIWTAAASRVIHVHILDPASCEVITRVVPPSIPPSAQEAVASKLLFFVVEEQVNNRLDGGDFDQVHSVSQIDKISGVASELLLDPSQPTVCGRCEKRLCDCM